MQVLLVETDGFLNEIRNPTVMKRFKLVCCSDSGAVAGGFPPFHSFFVATPATSFSVGKGTAVERIRTDGVLFSQKPLPK